MRKTRGVSLLNIHIQLVSPLSKVLKFMTKLSDVLPLIYGFTGILSEQFRPNNGAQTLKKKSKVCANFLSKRQPDTAATRAVPHLYKRSFPGSLFLWGRGFASKVEV